MKIRLTNGNYKIVESLTETVLLDVEGSRTSAISDRHGNLYTVTDRDAEGAIWGRVVHPLTLTTKTEVRIHGEWFRISRIDICNEKEYFTLDNHVNTVSRRYIELNATEIRIAE